MPIFPRRKALIPPVYHQELCGALWRYHNIVRVHSQGSSLPRLTVEI